MVTTSDESRELLSDDESTSYRCYEPFLKETTMIGRASPLESQQAYNADDDILPDEPFRVCRSFWSDGN